MSRFLFYIAVLPAVVLFIYIYKKDTVEKEPAGLLIKLFIGGALSTVTAMLLGTLGDIVLTAFLEETDPLFLLIENFIVVALVEEGGKYFFLKKFSWNHPAFNFTFDAVVYAVVAALGFATVENVLYVAEGGIGTAVMRALMSVPGHAIDGLFMGIFYGAAKRYQMMGRDGACRRNLLLALLVPTLMHGFYDWSLSTESDLLYAAFLIYEVVITITSVILVKRLSKHDQPIGDGLFDAGRNLQNAYRNDMLPHQSASFEPGRAERLNGPGFDADDRRF